MIEASAVILAGGRSSRMGRSKALLPFGGEPLIVHLVRQLAMISNDVLVVVAAGETELPRLPATIVRDRIEHRGPVAGMLFGLEAARHELAFVTSCDAPFLNPSLVSYVVSAVGPREAAVPRWQGRLQPLHAVYRRSVRGRLAEKLADGELRLTSLVEELDLRIVEAEEAAPFDPEGLSFRNLNRPEDYDQALDLWARRAAKT